MNQLVLREEVLVVIGRTKAQKNNLVRQIKMDIWMEMVPHVGDREHFMIK